MSIVTSSLPLLGSGFKQRTFLFLWVPELSPVSATSFPKQQLTKIELTHSLKQLTGPAYNSFARTALKTPLHYFSAIVAPGLLLSCLLEESLPNNGCCVLAYFSVVT
jgi:hypothetical protein